MTHLRLVVFVGVAVSAVSLVIGIAYGETLLLSIVFAVGIAMTVGGLYRIRLEQFVKARLESEKHIRESEHALRASEQRLVLENKALTELTASQVGGSAAVEERLSRILETCARTIDVDRVSIWNFIDDRAAISCVDLYMKGKDKHDAGQSLSRVDFPAYFKALEHDRLIDAGDAHRDSRTSEFSATYLSPFGIGAMLDVPLRQDEVTFGVLCLEHVGGPRSWTADEQNFVLSAANLIVVALSASDRRSALEMLAASEERARLVVDSAHDAFIGMNSAGTVVMWNSQAVSTFGWLREEAVGRSLSDLIIPPAFREAHRTGLRKFLETGHAPVVNQRLELTALDKKAREFPVEITITNPIRFEGGYFFGAFLRDISERRQHEAELRNAKESAEAATRAKSEFLANMSHELRTPLNGVLGYAQLLQRKGGLDAEQSDALEAIAKCGAHLLELINDVLDLSKIEAGRIELEPVATDVHQLATDLRHVIAEPARRKGLRFIVEIDPDVPSRVILDGRHLRQVLLNLLGNAVKFTQQGEIRLTLDLAADQRLHFEVRDTGIGIEEEHLQNIFGAFRQTRAGSAFGGTGLGLTISQRLAAAMGGNLSVKSTVGKGSSFFFSLLLVPVEGAAPSGFYQPSDEPDLNSRLASGQNLTALVADDSSVNRRILASLLESAGVRVISAEGGVEAVALAREHLPDVVLMDLRMRDLDGLEATRQILNDPATSSIPVIMVTASAFGDARQAALDAGCVDFISKPIRAEQLFEKLQRHGGVRFVSPTELSTSSDTSVEIPRTPYMAEIGRRLVEAVSIGNIAELESIARELHNGGTAESLLGRRVAQLAAAFDFAALEELGSRMQDVKGDSSAAT